jgi:flagellar motility protein MotE (MotC chaperone)
MCEKCVELDGKIEQFERIRASIGDPLTVDRLGVLVEEMKAQKAALHLEARVRPPDL